MKLSGVSYFLSAIWLITVSGYDINFNTSIIPQIRCEWPFLHLGSPVRLPASFLNQTLKNVAPGSNFTASPCGPTSGLIAQDGDRTVALVDPTTGETNIYPRFEGLLPGANISNELITQYINNINIIPRDDTNVTAVPGLNLYGATHTKDADSRAAPAEIYLANALVQRTIHVPGERALFPVRGPGSKAVFGFGADGTLQSLSHLWHPAQFGNSTISPQSPRDIQNAIIAQLQPSAQISPVTVDTVEAAFFDSGSQFIQPVFYFTATIKSNTTSSSNASAITHARISGYIPFGSEALEDLPDLTKPGDLSPPSYASNTNTTVPIIPRQSKQLEKRTASIKVGRYVVRNDSTAWVASANSFFSNLVTYSTPVFPFLPRVVSFLNSQYFWAVPFIFTTAKESFIDSVHIADTEVHGNWHLFSTYQNWGDIVSLSDIPASGFGPGAGGSLAYLILHSCEVIPSATDYPGDPQESFDAWWPIFNGLHAVMGYRTEMWIADGATTPFAQSIARGFAVVPAWMSAVHNDMAYAPSAGNIYKDGNRGINEPMGRASTISVCGHTDDVVWDVSNVGRPGCLYEWWYNN